MSILKEARELAKTWGSALYNLHPELADRVPLLRLWSDEDQRQLGDDFQAGADFYRANVWVRRAIEILANNLAPLPLEIWDRRTNEATQDHELIDLFLHVNDSLDPIDLWTQWTVDMMLGGESGFEVVKSQRGNNILELWPRRPDWITVRLDQGKRRYGGILGYKIDDGEGEWDVPADELIFFKFYNPSNAWRGLAPIAAVRVGVLIDEFARAWSRMFFKNAARPDLAVIAPAGVTRTEKDEILRRFSEQHSGVGQWHKPVVLEQGVTDVKTLSHPPKDIEWLEQRRFSRQEIAAIFGVPDECMGFGRDTYENFQTAMRALWMLTLVPLIRSRDARLTEFFRRIGKLPAHQRVRTSLSDVEVLREDKAAKVTMYSQMVQGMIPPNAALEYSEIGIAPLPGGDVGYGSIALTPLTGRARPQPQEEGKQKTIHAAKALTEPAAGHFHALDGINRSGNGFTEPFQDGHKHEVWHFDVMPAEGHKHDISDETLDLFSQRATTSGLEYGSPEHIRLWEHKAGRVDKYESRMVKMLRKAFQRQQNAVGRWLRNTENHTFGKGQAEGDGDAAERLVKQTAGYFDPFSEQELFREDFGPLLAEALFGVASTELIDLGLDIAFDLNRPEVQAELGTILQRFAEKVNDTTYNDLVGVFSQAEEEGLGIPGIMELLGSYWEGRKGTASCERIARTTMGSVNNAADEMAWQQTEGIVIGSRWLTQIDGRQRPAHEAAHNQPRPLGQMFDVGGELLAYPGDPNGSPGNVINCRCSRAGIVAGEAVE